MRIHINLSFFKIKVHRWKWFIYTVLSGWYCNFAMCSLFEKGTFNHIQCNHIDCKTILPTFILQHVCVCTIQTYLLLSSNAVIQSACKMKVGIYWESLYSWKLKNCHWKTPLNFTYFVFIFNNILSLNILLYVAFHVCNFNVYNSEALDDLTVIVNVLQSEGLSSTI